MPQDLTQWLQALANLATTLGIIIGAVGLFLVWRQLRQGTLSRDASICLTLAQFSSTLEFQQNLQAIQSLPTEGPLGDEDRAAAVRMCVFFELVGAICNHGYMQTRLIEQFYGSLVTRCYGLLKVFIENRRTETGNPLFGVNFEQLAKRLQPRLK